MVDNAKVGYIKIEIAERIYVVVYHGMYVCGVDVQRSLLRFEILSKGRML
jgi:hypothetical protein